MVFKKALSVLFAVCLGLSLAGCCGKKCSTKGSKGKSAEMKKGKKKKNHKKGMKKRKEEKASNGDMK